jgi:hypothetical protein
MTRRNGLSAAVTYAVVSTTIVHLVVTGLFVRLAVALTRDRTSTRVRATG